jgi:hypothetical protein
MRISTKILSSMLRWPLKWPPTASETIVNGPQVVIFQNSLPSVHLQCLYLDIILVARPLNKVL